MWKAFEYIYARFRTKKIGYPIRPSIVDGGLLARKKLRLVVVYQMRCGGTAGFRRFGAARSLARLRSTDRLKRKETAATAGRQFL